MGPDKYQQAWQTQSSQTRVKFDDDLLSNKVQRDQRNCRAENLVAHCLAAGMVLLSLPIWIYFCVVWYPTLPVIVWVTVLEVVFIRECLKRFSHQSQKFNEPGEPLIHWVNDSLDQVEREISGAHSFCWWVVLPASISFLAMMILFGSQSAIEESTIEQAAIERASKCFDERFAIGFLPAFGELSLLNHQGITDPQLKIASPNQPTDGPDHRTEVQNKVRPEDKKLRNNAVRRSEQFNRPPGGSMSVALVKLGGVIVVLPALMYFISQLGVHFRLEPRRRELLMLLKSLSDETTSKSRQRSFRA